MAMKAALIGILVVALAAGIRLAFWLRSEDVHPPEQNLEGGRIARIEARGVQESSGVVASRRQPGVFWTHNDQGNPPVIFAISREGKALAQLKVEAPSDDWEDISTDGEGNLYIANIGDNDEGRDYVEVYRVKEPDLSSAKEGGALPVEKTWRLKYPKEKTDAEALFIHDGHGYIASKVTKKRDPVLYRFPLASEDQIITLEEVATPPTTSPITAGALSSDARRLAFVTQKGLYVFDVNGDIRTVSSVSPRFIPFAPGHDIEGCTFVPEGILATSEKRDIYLFRESGWPEPGEDAKLPKGKRGKKE